MNKLNYHKGDRIKLTEEGREILAARTEKGTVILGVIAREPKTSSYDNVCIRRDGIKRVDYMHTDFIEKVEDVTPENREDG